ncbi:ABC transporter substrate-binding protein [Cupriavidus sp. USMAA2-4]|uniref:ABC transporter substrate-binding protein n=1 Tax=Cupriavidus malaysiensis TaxID=367825 RepID=A0ABM6F638_9BURK|nr:MULTISPECIES: extracellular solute-binding protein [Cupriavidus]AOY93476.1 ABC transporter substrate-binding protein [Cupriavidus sp. USMAA2-4]AOZ06991.1 ABC transporter substrate-binding protein [Cupriavidus malaysiensis]
MPIRAPWPFDAAGRRFLGRTVKRCGLALLLAVQAVPVLAAHGYAQYGDLKYGPDFTHFDYANPAAPRGGTLTLANPDRRTSFDKFNPFTLKGTAAPGLNALMFESLLIASADETASAYGLLADDVTMAPDQLSVTFHLRPQARFSNGDPVLASDVKYSYDMLMSKSASPGYRSMCEDVKGVVVLGPSTVRFDFKQHNQELPLIVGSLPVFSKKWTEKASFADITFEAPVTSGPYLIERYDAGRGIIYRRDPSYWGKDLAVRRGTFNFDRVVYRLYKDETARLEAFKAGEFDAIVEYRAKNWAKSYVGKRFDNGELAKTEFPHHNGAGMQGFVMNMRKPMFQDVRVRQALSLALDFEWLNRQLFYGAYRRLDSWFSNTDLAAASTFDGRPTPGELGLLDPLRRQLGPEVFGQIVAQPTTNPPRSLRDNLRLAQRLLAQAGWTYSDGALRNAKGEAFSFEFLDDGGAMSRVITAYVRNLEKLGIQVDQRTTDFALYQKRLEDFDFDMVSIRYPDSQSPGNELRDRFSSEAAGTPGSDNLFGLKSPPVDKLVDNVLHARTREELINACRALDRVLMHGYYIIPHWFSAYHRVAYRKELSYPQRLPAYYTAEGWILSNWWRNDLAPAKAQAQTK